MAKKGNFINHLKTVNHHRRLVRKLCFKVGLYKQGLIHDLSKYSYVEFSNGVKYFLGNKSPVNGEIADKGYSEAWLHHQGRNKHHWQYWTAVKGDQIVAIDMPLNYVKEMTCDRIAACMIYQKDKYHPSSALEFLENSKEKKAMSPKTYNKLKQYLQWVSEMDLDEALAKIKEDQDY